MTMAFINHRYPTTLGQRMRSKRLEKGWTQEQLALRANSNQAVIQKIENGKSLRPRRIDKLAEVLGVNPAWLMFGEESAPILPTDALSLADAWNRLPEPDKTRIQNEISSLASCA